MQHSDSPQTVGQDPRAFVCVFFDASWLVISLWPWSQRTMTLDCIENKTPPTYMSPEISSCPNSEKEKQLFLSVTTTISYAGGD